MAPRLIPGKDNAARRTALRRILVDVERMPADIADSWVRAWEGEAARLGIRPGEEYWTVGSVWIHERLRRQAP